MEQVARNATMQETGHLNGCRYLLHDHDQKFCRQFQETLKAGGVECTPLPSRSSNLNAHAERWVRSIKQECLSQLILFGEELVTTSRVRIFGAFSWRTNHQGKGNVLLFPGAEVLQKARGSTIECRARLGGLLKYYHRRVA
jgi:hypothetical protein